MKPEKSSFKKTVKNVTKSISKNAASVAARFKKAAGSATVKAAAASAPKQPSKTSTPKTKPKAAKPAASEVPDVPSILLEGDHPSSPLATGPGQRYSLGSVPPPEHIGGPEATGELPEAYGTEQLLLTARDPHWLYARWDLTRKQQQKYNSLSTDRHLVLRIYINEIKGEPYSQVHVHPESSHWFAHVAQAGVKYLGELGYYAAKGKWVTIATSSATLAPPDSLSDDLSAQFASIPMDIPFAQLLELARTAVEQNIPLIEVVQQLRADGYNFPPAKPGEKWTPARQQALASIITMDSVRRVWMGSLEITELTRRQLGISSINLAELSSLSSAFGAISSITSLASPFGLGFERRKSFWFNVNAELIIYGATEPDAEVTIGGRVIKLRPDGTFSYRFALPDGQYNLPAVATSSDKTDSRAADLHFERATEYRGDVGQHPQDSRLKPPLVEHVA